MQDATFDIEAIPGTGLLRLTMGGFYKVADVEALLSPLTPAVAGLGSCPNEHNTLCDIKAVQIQGQESVELFQRLVGSDPVRSHCLAFVVSATLARVQARSPTDRAN